jgi:hypothetical protein
MKKTAATNSTFGKWRVEKVLARSVFKLTFVASQHVEFSNSPLRQSEKR